MKKDDSVPQSQSTWDKFLGFFNSGEQYVLRMIDNLLTIVKQVVLTDKHKSADGRY